MNYLMKGLACFLGHSVAFRLLSLLWRNYLIDFTSAVTCGFLLIVVSGCLFYIWHTNKSMNENLINFIGIASLAGVIAGLGL